MGLMADDRLESSSVVANCAMNRERGLTGSNGYDRELGFDMLDELHRRLRQAPGVVRWLDLCCGSGRALVEAAEQLDRAGLTGRVQIYGLDLVGYFAPASPSPTLERITASVTAWAPPGEVRFDVITCVHGLHYVGDKLAVLSRVASWLAPEGIFAASFDPAGLRRADGAPLGAALTSALRRAGFIYHPKSRRLTRHGDHDAVRLPFAYLGADDSAGPNYTGQPAVHSYYEPSSR